jgi:hypothetical protein
MFVLLRLTRSSASGGDDDDGKSDAGYKYVSEVRNNMNMDFRRTDNSGRTGARNTRRDSS